jgi:phospholipase/carboxylesterase
MYMLEFKQYQLGKQPRNLVIFLHGYNGTLEDHQYAVDWLKKYLKNAILITPQAPEICDKNPQKRQWFGMLKYDPENLRRSQKTSIRDIFSIYDAAAAEIDSCADKINDFVSTQQKKYDIDDGNTFIIGFSQGAMLSIYAALIRPTPLGSVFALSGLVAAEKKLVQKISSYSPIYMFHGTEDMKVQYKTLPHSVKCLQKLHVPVKYTVYQDLAHQISEEEIKAAAEIINLSKIE